RTVSATSCQTGPSCRLFTKYRRHCIYARSLRVLGCNRQKSRDSLWGDDSKRCVLDDRVTFGELYVMR
ncbi:unnamed protein product, partial [Callosobruchus maculatus]